VPVVLRRNPIHGRCIRFFRLAVARRDRKFTRAREYLISPPRLHSSVTLGVAPDDGRCFLDRCDVRITIH